MTKPLMVLVTLLAVVLGGCVTNTITNLTSTTQPRDPKGMYRIEYQWDSTQQTVKPGSIKPSVIAGGETYEMKRVMNMTNRWEAWIPVPPNKNEVEYYIQVNYEYSVFGGVKPGGKRTKDYTLTIK